MCGGERSGGGMRMEEWRRWSEELMSSDQPSCSFEVWVSMKEWMEERKRR